MKNHLFALLFLYGLFLFNACLKQETADVTSAPQLPEQTFAYNDRPGIGQRLQVVDFSSRVENEAATLGRVLFYDPKLSATNRVSCSSCHLQSAAFSDVHQFSKGFTNELTRRNAMPICNTLLHEQFFWDLRALDLADLVRRPIEDHIEMGMEDMEVLAQKLATIDYYPPLFEKAFGVNAIDANSITTALTQFMDAMVSYNSKFDQGVDNNFANFNELENLGRTVFFEKANCTSCHSAPNFSPSWGSSAANIGLDLDYADPGLGIAGNSSKNGKFKIPSLRNVELTGPYMHDGRFSTLEQVVEHYNSGIQNHRNLSWHFRTEDGENVRRLDLSDLEKQGLVAFLKTLTDESFIQDPMFSNPFTY